MKFRVRPVAYLRPWGRKEMVVSEESWTLVEETGYRVLLSIWQKMGGEKEKMR